MKTNKRKLTKKKKQMMIKPKENVNDIIFETLNIKM